MDSRFVKKSVGWLAAVVACLHGSSAAPNEVAYVKTEGCKLFTINSEEASPALGEIFAGSAVLIQETRDGWAKVKVTGWVRRDQLAGDRPARNPEERGVSGVEPDSSTSKPKIPVPTGPRPKGLKRAHHIDLIARVVDAREDRPEALEVELVGVTFQGIAVEFDQPLPGTLSVFERRRLAGGVVRGKVLLRKPFSLGPDQSTLSLPLADLKLEGDLPASVLVEAEVPLGKGRRLYGSLQDVSLRPKKPPVPQGK